MQTVAALTVGYACLIIAHLHIRARVAYNTIAISCRINGNIAVITHAVIILPVKRQTRRVRTTYGSVSNACVRGTACSITNARDISRLALTLQRSRRRLRADWIETAAAVYIIIARRENAGLLIGSQGVGRIACAVRRVKRKHTALITAAVIDSTLI